MSAYDPKRTLALPQEVELWSLTTLREKLVKIGAKIVCDGRYITLSKGIPVKESLILVD